MTISTVTPQEVQALVSSGTPIDLIDVRSAAEFALVHASIARNVPLAQLDPGSILANRHAAKTDPIYLICASGSRSSTAAQAFIAAGFDRALSVAGGTNAWAAAGLPVTSAAKPPLISRSTLVAFAALAAVWLVIAFFWGNTAHAPQPASTSSAHPAPAAIIDFKRDVIEASRAKPVLVDFFATWCEPCTQLSPELEAVAEQNSGKISLLRIDIEKQEDIAIAQKIEPIPDVRLWKGGKEIAHFIGYKTRADVSAWLNEALTATATSTH